MIAFDDSIRVESYINQELEAFARAGFNTVVFCITETDLEQRCARRPNNSTIIAMLKQAKEHGLYAGVDPWNMGNIFGGEAASSMASTLTDQQGSVIGRQKADPFGRAFTNKWLQFLDVACSGGADFVFLDEPELPRRYSRSALLEFLDQRTTESQEFGLRNDVCLTINKLDALGPAILRLSGVDGLSTDPIYGGGEAMFSNRPGSNDDSVEAYVGGNAAKVQALAAAACKQAGVWIQGHSITAGHEEAIIYDGVQEAAKYVSSIGYWHTRYSNIRPQDPELAWNIATSVFSALSARYAAQS